MAYYEMMPAGLPAGLQTGMDAVLNKKFGTATSYAPGTWPDTVNLLGQLEEKTQASASVCSFEDGADDVPSSSVKVTIPPTLTGVSEVSATQTGRNLFNYEAVEPFNNNVIITRNDGDYTLQNNNSYGVGAFRGISFHLKPASYSLSLGEAITVPVRIYKNDAWFNNGINAGSTSCNFTVTEEDDYTLSCTVPANSSLTIKKCQFEFGSTAHDYEPYQTPTTYTASLGRTIYGGEVDIVNGKCDPTNWLDDTLANLEQGSINGSTGANENANNRVRNASAIPFPYDEIVSSYTWTIPSGYKVAIRPYDANGNFVQLPSWALAFVTQLPQDLIGQGIAQMRFVLAKTDNSAITPSEMVEVGYILNKGNTAKAYSPYFAPFTFDGQEVPTRLGYNAFWSDGGDTEVRYRSSGTITPASLTTKTITVNGTYNASDDSADGYSSVTVNVPAPQITAVPLISEQPYIYVYDITGTDVTRIVKSYTAASAGKFIFSSASACMTNTASNEGFMDIQKNGVSIVKQYLTTDVKTGITIPDIDVEIGDIIDIIAGFDNYHSSCEFRLYTAIVEIS